MFGPKIKTRKAHRKCLRNTVLRANLLRAGKRCPPSPRCDGRMKRRRMDEEKSLRGRLCEKEHATGFEPRALAAAKAQAKARQQLQASSLRGRFAKKSTPRGSNPGLWPQPRPEPKLGSNCKQAVRNRLFSMQPLRLVGTKSRRNLRKIFRKFPDFFRQKSRFFFQKFLEKNGPKTEKF